MKVSSALSSQAAALHLPWQCLFVQAWPVLSCVSKRCPIIWALVLIRTCRDAQFSSEQPRCMGNFQVMSNKKEPHVWFNGPVVAQDTLKDMMPHVLSFQRQHTSCSLNKKKFKFFYQRIFFYFTYIKESFSSLKCNQPYMSLGCR